MDAKWIWLDPTTHPDMQRTFCTMLAPKEVRAGAPYGVAEFCRTVALREAPVRVRLRVSGDTVFRLWLNDRFVGEGPVCAGGDWLTFSALPWHFANRYTCTAAEKELKFFAQVRLTPQVWAEYSAGRGGFYLSGEAEYRDGSTERFGTDGRWAARLNPQYIAPNEWDGTRPMPAWAPCAETGDTRTLLDADQRMLNTQPQTPARTEPNRPLHPGETLWADYDRIYTAHIGVRVNGACRLTLEARETPDKPTVQQTLTFAGAGEYRSIGVYSVGELHIQVVHACAEVAVEPLLDFTCYPTDAEGTLRTSDPELDRIYDVCKHTLRICRQSIHLDSPLHQEMLACTGDYYIETKMTAFTFGDMSLAAADIRRTARWLECNDGRMFHTAYSLIWVQWLRLVYTWTADAELVRFCAPALTRLLRRFETYCNADGIIDHPPDYMFVDWMMAEGYSLHHPPKALGQTVLNAFYYKALTDAIALAEVLQRTGDHSLDDAQHRWRTRCAVLKPAFHRCFWNPDRRLYIDGLPTPAAQTNQWQPENPPIVHFSRYANTLAALYGLCPPSEAARLVRTVCDEHSALPPVQPYFLNFILEAAVRTGVAQEFGLTLFDRYRPLVRACTKGLAEGWYAPTPGYAFDHSHAWGGCPAWALPQLITGFRMEEPGFARVSFAPRLWGLQHAEVTFPTPRGEICCRLVQGEPPQLTVPAGISYTVRDEF